MPTRFSTKESSPSILKKINFIKGNRWCSGIHTHASSLFHFRATVLETPRGSEGPVECLHGCVHRRNVCGFVGLCPVWIVGQVKHGDAPRVDGQWNAEDAQNVHDQAGFHLRSREREQRWGEDKQQRVDRAWALVCALPCLWPWDAPRRRRWSWVAWTPAAWRRRSSLLLQGSWSRAGWLTLGWPDGDKDACKCSNDSLENKAPSCKRSQSTRQRLFTTVVNVNWS